MMATQIPEEKKWLAILGVDDRFRRSREYYLAYSQAGLETDALNVSMYKVVRAL